MANRKTVVTISAGQISKQVSANLGKWRFLKVFDLPANATLQIQPIRASENFDFVPVKKGTRLNTKAALYEDAAVIGDTAGDYTFILSPDDEYIDDPTDVALSGDVEGTVLDGNALNLATLKPIVIAGRDQSGNVRIPTVYDDSAVSGDRIAASGVKARPFNGYGYANHVTGPAGELTGFADPGNYFHNSAYFYLNIVALPAAAVVTLSIDFLDGIAGAVPGVQNVVTKTFNAPGLYKTRINPYVAAAANVDINDILPVFWRWSLSANQNNAAGYQLSFLGFLQQV